MFKRIVFIIGLAIAYPISADEMKSYSIEINSDSNYEFDGAVYYSISELDRDFPDVSQTDLVNLLRDAHSDPQNLIYLMNFLRDRGVLTISISTTRD